MANYTEIIIHWGKRKQIDDLKEFEITDKKVLYQIYGNHHIYGRNILLYIGKSINVNRRLDQHLKSVFNFVNNRSVIIGTIDDEFFKEEDLEIPESILIANHKPSFNKEFIHELSPKAKQYKILVINNGNHEMLKSCCTNFWWVDNIL